MITVRPTQDRITSCLHCSKDSYIRSLDEKEMTVITPSGVEIFELSVGTRMSTWTWNLCRECLTEMRSQIHINAFL